MAAPLGMLTVLSVARSPSLRSAHLTVGTAFCSAANVDLAYQFINYILSTEVQQREAETGVDAPVATAVKLEPAQAALWVYGQDMVDSLNRVEYDKMNQVKSDWIDRWNEIFGG